MVHNGIEYGMMQAYAEGFAIMKAKKDFQLNLHLNVSAPVITQALQRRIRLPEEDPFADKLLGAMRKGFGGHAIKEG
jgi:6-phosphogluconate dehydrogenase